MNEYEAWRALAIEAGICIVVILIHPFDRISRWLLKRRPT